MSIRTTVTLDDDVIARLKEESKARAVSFKDLLNEAVRSGLVAMKSRKTAEPFKVRAFHMGTLPGLNYDDIGSLIERADGQDWH